MGANKLHLQLQDRPIYEYGVDVLAKAPVDEKLLVTNDEAIAAYAQTRGLRTVANPEAPEGKSASIRQGVKAAGAMDAYIFIMADQPLLTVGTLEKLVQAHKTAPDKIICPEAGGRPGSPVLVPSAFRDALLALSGDKGAKSFMNGENTRIVHIEDVRELWDVDVPDAYAKVIQEQSQK